MVPLRIAALNFELSPALELDLRKRTARLAHFYRRMVRVVVTIDTPQRRRRSDAERYRVRLELTLPGGEVVITRQPHADLRTAFQDAFSAARRRLEDYARRQYGAVKARETLRRGRVSQYYPLGGYGFIEEAEDGHEVYFDAHGVLDGAWARLDVGAEVRFTEEPGQRGPQATSVHVAPSHVTAE